MQPLTLLGHALLRTLRDHLRPLIAYHLLFTLLASALLLPTVAWLSQRFLAQLNRTVVTTDALLALLFSPLGLLVMLVGFGLTFFTYLLAASGYVTCRCQAERPSLPTGPGGTVVRHATSAGASRAGRFYKSEVISYFWPPSW